MTLSGTNCDLCGHNILKTAEPPRRKKVGMCFSEGRISRIVWIVLENLLELKNGRWGLELVTSKEGSEWRLGYSK